MHIGHDVPLAPLTTLRLGGRAARVAVAESEQDVVDALENARSRSESVFVLGGGSNVVIADEGWPGLVLKVGLSGVQVDGRGAQGRVYVEAAAGEPWEALVERGVGEGWSGIECLSGIPGLVGATPIQNVGAYGQEVRDTIVQVRALDRTTGAFVDLAPEACAFGYRSSMFRGSQRHVIVRVRFCFEASSLAAPIRYSELARALGVREGDRVPAVAVRQAVLGLRASKGMLLDPRDPDAVSVGSFFVNPTLDGAGLASLEAKAAAVLQTGESMPRFAVGPGRWKVPAAWLVERAGFRKGHTAGGVAVSTKHTLALVNRGKGTTRELLALAREIRDGVRARFGVELAAEPVMVGCEL